MSSFFLKIFAIFFMIFDHIGLILFPENLLFRAIGRLALPLFAYQMAVGFSHTKNKPKHIIKLLLFAIVCQLPYSMLLNLYNLDFTLNIIFTFVFALLMIFSFENFAFLNYNEEIKKYNINIKNFIVSTFLGVILLFLGIYLNVDYSWYGILLTVAFYFTLSKKWLSLILFFILVNLNYILNPNIMTALAYLSLFDAIFILFFNGKRGYKFSWVFYAIYFLHLFPLLFIKQFLI